LSAQEETVGDLPIDWSVNQTDTQDTEIGSGVRRFDRRPCAASQPVL